MENIKGSELEKILKELGCYFLRDGGNHEIWYSPITNKRFPVPRHKGKEVKTGTAKSILKDAGLK